MTESRFPNPAPFEPRYLRLERKSGKFIPSSENDPNSNLYKALNSQGSRAELMSYPERFEKQQLPTAEDVDEMPPSGDIYRM